MAIRSTAAVAILGITAQASAIDLSTGGYDVNLYGFARFAASYDIGENLGVFGGQAASFDALDFKDTASEGHFGADANTSRVGLSVMTPEDVKVVVEFDFDNNNTLLPRLRQAYGEYNNVLLGQTWSNYNSFVGNTATLDFDGTPGVAGYQSRLAQLRYTTGPFSFSLEESKATILGAKATETIVIDDSVTPSVPVVEPKYSLADPGSKTGAPALTARFEDSQGGLSYSAAALVHQLQYETASADDSVIGAAAFLAARFALTDMMTLQGAINYTNGGNSYLYRSGADFGGPSAYVGPNGDLETISGYGGTVGVGIDLGSGSSVNIGYGLVTLDWDDAKADLAAVDTATGSSYEALANASGETNQSAFANYNWAPVKGVKFGVQYSWLEQERVDGNTADGSRVLFVSQYSF